MCLLMQRDSPLSMHIGGPIALGNCEVISMNEKNMEACKIIHTNLLPRMRFLRESLAAMAESERDDDDHDGTSLYDGAVIALDDMIDVTSKLINMLEK